MQHPKYLLVERFADNGQHSHWDLIDSKTQHTVWSEDGPIDLDELWDDHSEYIDDDIDSLSNFAGKTVITGTKFKALMNLIVFPGLTRSQTPPPSSHQGEVVKDSGIWNEAIEAGRKYQSQVGRFGGDKNTCIAVYADGFIDGRLSQAAPPTPVEGPTPTVWKEIEEELIECYEDYPAMNAEQDARKKIDEWKAKSQQELQGRKGALWVNTFKGDDKGWQLCRVIGSDKRIPMLITQNLVCDPAGKTYKHDEIEYLSDSPAPEQVDVIDAYKEYVQLLTDELSELVGVAAVHGWKSTRHEKGVELRNKIESLQNKQG